MEEPVSEHSPKVENKNASPNVIKTTKSEKLKNWLSHNRLILMISTAVVVISICLVAFTQKNKTHKSQLARTSQNPNSSSTKDYNNNPQLSCVAPSSDRYYRTDRSLAIDPSNGQHLFVAIEYKGAYQSFDGGQTWKQTLQDFKWRNGCFPEPFKALISPTDSKTIYISTNGDGILRTTDSGQTWKKLFKDWMYNKSEDFNIDPTNSSILYAATSDVQGAPNASDNSPVTKGLVYKSTDKGDNWVELPTGLQVGAGNNGVVISKTDPNHLLAFTLLVHFHPGGRQIDTSNQMGILESKDAGQSWKAIHTIPAGYDATGFVAFSPLVPNNIYVTSFTAPGTPELDFYSRDFGISWKASNTVMAYVFYDPFDASGLHLLGINDQPNVNTLNKFYESKDGGKTWNQSLKYPVEVTNSGDHKTLISNIKWSPTDKNTLFVSAASGYVWKSADNGQTWLKILSADNLPK